MAQEASQSHAVSDDGRPSDKPRLSTILLASVVVFTPMVIVPLYGLGRNEDLAMALSGFFSLGIAFAVYRPRWWSILAVLAGAWLLLELSAPSCAVRANPPERMLCTSRIRVIAGALMTYREQHGTFPPAYVSDPQGKPMHSWRVLILPCFNLPECSALYGHYDINEPWDGPNNRKLLSKCPEPYRCRDALPARSRGDSSTSYVAVVGRNAAWPPPTPGGQPGKRSQDTVDSVMLLEVPASAGIAWTRPEDFSLDAVKDDDIRPAAPITHRRIDNLGLFVECEGTWAPEASVALVDIWRTGVLSEEEFSASRLRQRLSVGGCELPHDADLPRAIESHTRVKTAPSTAAAIWGVSILLLLRQAARARKQRTAAAG